MKQEDKAMPTNDDNEKSSELLKAIEQLESAKSLAKGSGDSNQLMLITSMILVLTTLSTYSPNAEAASLNDLIEKFAKKISEQLTKQLGPMFESIMGIFLDGWGAVMNSEGDKTTESLGKVGDSINTVLTTIEKEKLKRATAPRYNACDFDEAAKKEAETKAEIVKKHDNRMYTSSQRYLSSRLGGNQSSVDHVSKLIKSQATSSDKAALLNPSTLTKDNMSSEDIRNARDSIDLLASSARLNMQPIDISESSSVSTKMEAGKTASKAISIELATNTLMRDLARRETDTNNPDSEHKLLKSQIDNTYYSQDWRNSIQGYADPTPCLIDISLQTATTNKLLFESLLAIQEQNKLSAAQLLKLNED